MRAAKSCSLALVIALAPGPARAPAAVGPARPLAVVRSARSGPWSAPATWEGGKVPAAGARVLVRPGHAVTYDVASDPARPSSAAAGAWTSTARP
jgi:hypothetical protein